MIIDNNKSSVPSSRQADYVVQGISSKLLCTNSVQNKFYFQYLQSFKCNYFPSYSHKSMLIWKKVHQLCGLTYF